MEFLRLWRPSASESIATHQLHRRRSITKLSSALNSSNGAALVVVHPYSAEIPAIVEEGRFAKYTANLKMLVEQSGLPLVLFEESERTAQLDTTLERMGKSEGEVFVVATESKSPQPEIFYGTDLQGITDRFFRAGMRTATIGGTYFRRNSIPPTLKVGCVDKTIYSLLDSGVAVTISDAVY